ncbi:uncharacterized protein LOC143063290 [Mytilus galloprovincialis]|uniref:uncharacterized protein LOC143063290 n=1 Tax=Mytilus galloprovincialis TaxID=29158 RepID=UPI003F7C2394
MTYPCLNKFCHGTEHCHLTRHEHNIVSSCSTLHVPNSNEYCVNHDSINSHGCYCDTADCVQNTALHCLGVMCNPSQGCEIYRQNGEIIAQCYSWDKCGDNCIHRCHEPLILDYARLPCYCDSQVCADRIEIPTVTSPVPTKAVPVLQQFYPYACLASNCDKYEPFCQLFEANKNVEGRCMVIKIGQLCSPANDLSVHGGCYCSDSKCVSNALTDYNQKHTTAATLVTEFPLNNQGTRTCHICGEMTIQVPCSSGQIGKDLPHTCKTGVDYCMTDIVQDALGNVDVFKRCVDLATCENKWITESAGLDYCKHYGVVKNLDAHSCHFCCTQDKCNSMLVPNATTWYTKTN